MKAQCEKLMFETKCMLEAEVNELRVEIQSQSCPKDSLRETEKALRIRS